MQKLRGSCIGEGAVCLARGLSERVGQHLLFDGRVYPCVSVCYRCAFRRFCGVPSFFSFSISPFSSGASCSCAYIHSSPFRPRSLVSFSFGRVHDPGKHARDRLASRVRSSTLHYARSRLPRLFHVGAAVFFLFSFARARVSSRHPLFWAFFLILRRAQRMTVGKWSEERRVLGRASVDEWKAGES